MLEAGSGGAALDLIGREPNIDLMIADFAIPGMNGAEVAASPNTTGKEQKSYRSELCFNRRKTAPVATKKDRHVSE